MNLFTLLEHLDYEVLQGSTKTEVVRLVYDSRKVVPGACFLCIAGLSVDGHAFISDALDAGAAALVVEHMPEVSVPESVTVIRVPSARYALARMSAAWFGYPAEQLTTIGVTGTKGKTTTTYMIKSILEQTGMKVGLIGTIETIIAGNVTPSNNTTPESYEIHEKFREMVDAGIEAVVMEVSSQGLKLHRTAGIEFDYGIFTNLARDHISPTEHPDFEDYQYCKGLLFKQCKVGICNIDDPHVGAVLAGHTCTVETFGFSEKADLRAEHVTLLKEPGCLGVSYDVAGLLNFPVRIRIPGRFSVYNSLTAIAVCRHFQIPEEQIAAALAAAKVKGRIEVVDVKPDYTLMIDYAHNAFGLESLLGTLREYEPGRLVCLFGCGGDRSRDRRFEMGEVSGKMADLTVITSDNPRTEDPMQIIADIRTGIARTDGAYVEIPDRREAIEWVIKNGRPGDVIVLAGKGHEDYQEINHVKYPMDERVIVAEIREKLNREARAENEGRS